MMIMMMMVIMRFLKGRPVELVHPNFGVELDDGLQGEGAGPRPRVEVGSRLRFIKCVGGGGCGEGASTLSHHRPPAQARLADLDEMVRAGRLAHVMDMMIVRISGLGDEGGGDAVQFRQGRPLSRPHGPIAEDAALGRG